MYNETKQHQKQKAITTAPATWGSSVDQVGAGALIGQPRRDPSRAPSLMTHDCRSGATARPPPTSLGFKVSVKVERATLSRKNHGGACGPVGTMAPSVTGDGRPHPVPGRPPSVEPGPGSDSRPLALALVPEAGTPHAWSSRAPPIIPSFASRWWSCCPGFYAENLRAPCPTGQRTSGRVHRGLFYRGQLRYLQPQQYTLSLGGLLGFQDSFG